MPGCKKAVFLDRDGTIIEERGYIKNPEEIVFFPDVISALRVLQERFLLFIITNQSGVGEGYITIDDVEQVNYIVLEVLRKEGVRIEKIYYCPHIKTDRCKCRKPEPYYIYKASEEYGLDISKSFTIGDHPCDVEMAIKSGATGIFVLTGHGRKHLLEIPPSVMVVENISEAIRYIMEIDGLRTVKGILDKYIV
ncbi:MAG: HAD-IIIA family hydrolase [bacterium]|nr:HAD-IIIA family hydrolase [bacterium]